MSLVKNSLKSVFASFSESNLSHVNKTSSLLFNFWIRAVSEVIECLCREGNALLNQHPAAKF